MEWFFDVMIMLCSVSVMGMFLFSLEGKGSIFKSVRTVSVLVLSILVINSMLNVKIPLPEFESDYNAEVERYSDGVRKALCESLGMNIKAEIESIYPDAEAEVYVISDLTNEYRLDISYVSVTVKTGNVFKIKKLIEESCGIENDIISVEKV